MQSILENSRKPDIVFHKSGSINISARVSKLLGLSPGAVIDIMSDDKEFYLYCKSAESLLGRHNGTVYPSNCRGNHYRASSKKLCNFILKECGQEQKASLYVGEPYHINPIGLGLPIITRICL